MAGKFEERDVVIVGSGPAGCATALGLRTYAPEFTSKVLVIEALRHPREKVCAGGVNGRAWHLLEDLGVSLDAPFVEVDRGLIRTALGDKWVESPGMTRVLQRDSFDAAVAAHLPENKIELREGVRLERVRRVGSKFDLETSAGTIRASAVVGADGPVGVVRKCLFDAPDKTCLMAMATCPATGHYTHTRSAVMLDFCKAAEGAHGYRWIFPFLNDGEEWVNVGICEWKHRSARELKDDLVGYMRSQDLDVDRAGFRFFPERPFHPRNPFSAPGVLLVGDAAGIDPFFGEGISYGIEYGMLAALSLAAALEHNDFTFQNHTSTLKWSRLGKELMITWMAAGLFYSRWHLPLARVGMSDDYLLYLLGDVLAGRLRPSKKLAAKMLFRVAKGLLKL